MIVKRGKKYLVKTSDGARTLGTHATEDEAKTQLKAIEIAKARSKDEEAKPLKRGYFVAKP